MKVLARHILLAALVLRALLPLGWMPSQAQKGALVLCTMDGAKPFSAAPGKEAPGKQTPDDTQHHVVCPFSAAPHLAKMLDATPFTAPVLQAGVRPNTAPIFATPASAQFSPQSPRAPPASA